MEKLNDLPINLFDAGVIVVLLGSAIFAYARGFVHEVFSIVGWIGAIAATFYGFPFAQPYARQLIETEILADLTSGTLIFLFALVVLSTMSRSVSRKVKDSALNALDRALGFLFGLVRGALIVVVAFIGFEILVLQKDYPDWVRSARTLQLIEPAAGLLLANLPEDYAIKRYSESGIKNKSVVPRDTRAVVRDLITPSPKASNKRINDGYRTRERQDMERLIGNTQ
ncbi:MAG: hypothetical protein CMF66_06440 [Magnetovibrio sp.]|nr:hypothetical protein [Magnetovibrio sp.]